MSAKTNLAQANAEIILALLKMGIYMERDRVKLDTLSLSAQNARLRKAFDRAVENCCIFQLLFSKEEREIGKLSLSRLPEWNGWRTARSDFSLQGTLEQGMESFVKSLGTHSLWAPFRMGRCSVTDSALVQGASVRLKDDVPEMEDLLMRCLSFVSMIDLMGSAYQGGFWGLTPLTAQELRKHMASISPVSRAACLAIQPLNVFEVQLPDDIDDESNESASAEPQMARAGYRGNKNRRAVGIVVVRYATSLPGLGLQKNVKSFLDYAGLKPFDPKNGYLTAAQLVLFSRLLDSNSRRLDPAEIKKYQAQVPKHVANETKISFISPVYCPSGNLADQLEIGRRPRLSCAVCEQEQSADVKLSFCAACSGVAYCSSEHQSADWASHKPECRSKIPKLPIAIRKGPTKSSPIVKVLLPLEYRSSAHSFGPKFANYVNPAERLKPPRKSAEIPQCSKTVYAHDERFLVRARWGGHADRMFGVEESDRRSGKFKAGPGVPQAMLEMVMGIIHIVDRPVSLGVMLQKQTGQMRDGTFVLPNIPLPGVPGFDVNNTELFETIVDIIKRSRKDKAEAAYFWATRKGDCIEVDLEDLPDQSLGW